MRRGTSLTRKRLDRQDPTREDPPSPRNTYSCPPVDPDEYIKDPPAMPPHLQCVAPPPPHPGGNPGANLKSISHRCHPILVAFVWELTIETTILPLGCLQGG